MRVRPAKYRTPAPRGQPVRATRERVTLGMVIGPDTWAYTQAKGQPWLASDVWTRTADGVLAHAAQLGAHADHMLHGTWARSRRSGSAQAEGPGPSLIGRMAVGRQLRSATRALEAGSRYDHTSNVCSYWRHPRNCRGAAATLCRRSVDPSDACPVCCCIELWPAGADINGS